MRIGGRVFEGPGPFVMGVVNATPDSFSDGGRHADAAAAVAHAERLVSEGADLIDVGGESTRPGAPDVPADLEVARVIPVIELLLARGCTTPISIDTRKAAVAGAALRAGASLVNDVSGLVDPAMAELVASTGSPAVVMHTRGTPRDMNERAVYGDVVGEVERELTAALENAVRRGVDESAVLLDPGLGFAKKAEHTVALLGAVRRLRRLGRPLVIGPSRKSFIGKLTGAAAADRLPGTLAAVTVAVLHGAEFVRVHDVAAARQAALVAAAIRDASGSADQG